MFSLDYVFVFGIVFAIVAWVVFYHLRRSKEEADLTNRGVTLLQRDLCGKIGISRDDIESKAGLAIVETLLGHTFVPGREFSHQDRKVGGISANAYLAKETFEVRDVKIVHTQLALACIYYELREADLNKRLINSFSVLVALTTTVWNSHIRFVVLDRLDLKEYKEVRDTRLWGKEYDDGPHLQGFHYGVSLEPSSGQEEGVAVRIDGRIKLYRDVLEGRPYVVNERFFRNRIIRFKPSKL